MTKELKKLHDESCSKAKQDACYEKKMDVEVVPEFYDLFKNSEMRSSKFITSWLFIRGKREIRNPSEEPQKKLLSQIHEEKNKVQMSWRRRALKKDKLITELKLKIYKYEKGRIGLWTTKKTYQAIRTGCNRQQMRSIAI